MGSDIERHSNGIERRSNGTFAEGVSGNPSGRPKEVREVIELAHLHHPTALATLVDRSSAFRAVRAASKRAGIGDWVGLHTLRHSYASILFSRGASAVQVQRLLGHHSPSFTLSIYVHLLPGDLPDPVYLDELLPLDAGHAGSLAPTETGIDAPVAAMGSTRIVAAVS